MKKLFLLVSIVFSLKPELAMAGLLVAIPENQTHLCEEPPTIRAERIKNTCSRTCKEKFGTEFEFIYKPTCIDKCQCYNPNARGNITISEVTLEKLCEEPKDSKEKRIREVCTQVCSKHGGYKSPSYNCVGGRGRGTCECNGG